MGKWRNLKIGTKLNLLTASAAAGLLIFAVLTFYTISRIKVGSDFFVQKVISSSVAADFENPPQSLQKVYSLAVEAEDAATPATRQPLVAQIREARKDYESGHQHYVQVLPPGALHDLVAGESNAATEAWYNAAEQQFFPALEAGDHTRAEAARTGPMEAAYHRDSAAVDEITRLTTAWDADNDRKAVAEVSSKTWMMAIAAGLILLVLITLGMGIARQIVGQVGKTAAALQSLAECDLTIEVEVDSSDEIGMMASSVQSTVVNIRKVMGAVWNGVETLSSAAAQLSAQAVQASSNAQSQSAKTGQIAAAAAEMTATIGEISQNAESASSSSRESAERAQGL